MRFQMMRTFPGPRQRGWDYIEDFRTWPEWMDVDLIDSDESARTKPGDTVRLAGKVLGLPIRGELILEEFTAPEVSRTLYRWPGWPDIHVEQRYTHAGPGAFTLELTAHTREDEGWLGNAVAWSMMNISQMMRRQVQSDFDRLDEAFRKGLAAKKPVKATKKATPRSAKKAA